MKGGVITDSQFDALSKENVLHWVSAHIIPVSIHHFAEEASLIPHMPALTDISHFKRAL